jgi:hypothetical protein
MLVPEASKLDGIAAARLTLKRCVFHPRCETPGMAALEQYRREWDDERKTFKADAVHDWTSHLADAFRYMSLAWRNVVDVLRSPSGFRSPANSFRRLCDEHGQEDQSLMTDTGGIQGHSEADNDEVEGVKPEPKSSRAGCLGSRMPSMP